MVDDDKNNIPCSVTLEYRTKKVNSLGLPGSDASTSNYTHQFKDASILVLEDEKEIQILPAKSKSAPFRFKLCQFMYFNAHVDRGKIGLKIFESRHNAREVLILINSEDIEIIQELNEGILSSQGRLSTSQRRNRSLLSHTPSQYGSPNPKFGRSPELKKSKENTSPNRIRNRFAFAHQTTHRSPQLSLASSPANGVNANKKLFPSSSLQRARTPNLSDLSSEQRAIVDAVLAGESVFFTGSGGCGKSFLLKKIISLLPPETTAVTASTGIAACHINGTTLHHFLGVGKTKGVAAQVISKLQKNFDKKNLIKKTKILIIDEISLIDNKMFELTHEVLSGIRTCNQSVSGKRKFFGGIQLICSGDFLQLPPVGLSNQPSGNPLDEVKFCFQSKLWKRAITKKYQLTKIFRQEDEFFSNILNQIRFGICSSETADLLLSRVRDVSVSDSNAIKLLPLNREVEEVNEREISKLPRDAHRQTFVAIDTVYDTAFNLDMVCPVKGSITLTVGAKVILLATLSFSDKLVNGSVGTVVRFSKSPAVAYVKFATIPDPVGVSMYDWTFKQSGSEVARRRQLPLALAWGISIHKSQGMTLEKCEVGLERIFEAGQAYVALSRCKSIEGLTIISSSGRGITASTIQRAIRANPVCVEYYQKKFSF